MPTQNGPFRASRSILKSVKNGVDLALSDIGGPDPMWCIVNSADIQMHDADKPEDIALRVVVTRSDKWRGDFRQADLVEAVILPGGSVATGLRDIVESLQAWTIEEYLGVYPKCPHHHADHPCWPVLSINKNAGLVVAWTCPVSDVEWILGSLSDPGNT